MFVLGNQNQQGTLMSDKVTNCESSVKLAPYSEPASTHSGPETTECSYSACNGAPHSHKEVRTHFLYVISLVTHSILMRAYINCTSTD